MTGNVVITRHFADADGNPFFAEAEYIQVIDHPAAVSLPGKKGKWLAWKIATNADFGQSKLSGEGIPPDFPLYNIMKADVPGGLKEVSAEEHDRLRSDKALSIAQSKLKSAGRS